MYDVNLAEWRKSNRSGNGGNCVEVARNFVESDGVVLVRDSKNPDGPHLTFTPDEWNAFVGGVTDGEFNLLLGTAVGRRSEQQGLIT